MVDMTLPVLCVSVSSLPLTSVSVLIGPDYSEEEDQYSEYTTVIYKSEQIHVKLLKDTYTCCCKLASVPETS